MQRSDREIVSRSEIDAVIRGAQICRLAFAVRDEPYVVPVSFGFDGSSLYFHTSLTGKKIECIEANDRVCFEMERNVELRRHPASACKWTFSFESVIGYGTVRELRSAAEKSRGLNQIMLQYSGKEWVFEPGELTSTRVWCVDIGSVTGKRSRVKAAT